MFRISCFFKCIDVGNVQVKLLKYEIYATLNQASRKTLSCRMICRGKSGVSCWAITQTAWLR